MLGRARAPIHFFAFCASRMMLRLVAFAALCAIAMAQTTTDIAALRAQMEKRIEMLEEKLAQGWCACSSCLPFFFGGRSVLSLFLSRFF
jgi:hypothetical protein